jgi:hypothetical protein
MTSNLRSFACGSARLGHRIQLALGAAAALAAISLSPGSAHAVLVTVGGVQYEVTTFTGTYANFQNRFNTPANNGRMPWWGNLATTNSFAAAVGNSLGYPNSLGSDTFGPIFAMGYDGNMGGRYYGYCNPTCNTSINDYYRTASESRVWAQVGADPVPAPLPVLGSAAVLGFCRRLRSRSQRLRHATGSRLA